MNHSLARTSPLWRSVLAFTVLAGFALLVQTASGQQKPPAGPKDGAVERPKDAAKKKQPKAQPKEEPKEEEDPKLPNLIDAVGRTIPLKKGPFVAPLGSVARIKVPENYGFIESKDVGKFEEMLENPAGKNRMGALISPENWFIIFSFEDIGYVKDDEKDSLDADAILASIREGSEASNAERRRRNWPEMHVVGWDQKPFFDPQTKNLTWAIQGESNGDKVTNYNSRVLGRGGVMSCNLVISPEELQRVVPTYKTVLQGFEYTEGNRYSEFRAGDKVATYGLAALVAGGSVAVLAKTGILGKLIKPIIIGVVALAGAIGAAFKRIARFFGFGRDSTSQA
jgi:uncharacterized membrane-anchored protein